MNTIKAKVGTLALTAARTVQTPQETVRVEPGTYSVFAFIEWTPDGGGMYEIKTLSAEAEGITTHAWYGRPNDSCIGKRRTAAIRLATYGMCPRRAEGLTLIGALEIHEWDPPGGGRMWRVQLRKGSPHLTNTPHPVRVVIESCDGCGDVHPLGSYRVANHTGVTEIVRYCEECAGAARIDWNGETAAVEAVL